MEEHYITHSQRMQNDIIRLIPLCIRINIFRLILEKKCFIIFFFEKSKFCALTLSKNPVIYILRIKIVYFIRRSLYV